MPITLVHKATPMTDPILAAADRMEPTIRQAFLDAVAALKAQVDMKKLTQAIADRDPDAVLAILAIDVNFPAVLQGVGLEAGIKSVRDAVQQTWAAGAEAAMTSLPAKISVNLSFDMFNPETVQHLNSYAFDLIRQVTQDQRDAVRQVVTRAFQEGGHPFQQAREIREVIGLTARQEQAVANYRDALEGGNYQNALDRALRDGRFDRSVMSSIQNGTSIPQDRIDNMVDRYRSRYTTYRAETISRTESLRASNKGQRELWSQARQQGLLSTDAKRVWIVSGDEATCEECQALAEGDPVGMDEEFAPGVMDPPDPHPSCLPVGTSITALGVSNAIRRWYEGEICIIRVFGFPDLTITPNHPVLGEFGWVPAGTLKVGDRVAQCIFPPDASFDSYPYNNYMETGIEQVFDSLIIAGGMLATGVPASTKAFHGDAGTKCEVDIVRTTSTLSRNTVVESLEDCKDLLLAVREGRRVTLNPHSTTAKILDITFAAPDSIMCSSDSRHPCLWRSLGGLNKIGLSTVALLESDLVPPARDGDSVDANSPGDAKHTFTGQMCFVEISEVNRRYFFGHVYNLETADGFYVANGIITHNCRCTVAIDPDSFKGRGGEYGLEEVA